MRGSKTILVLLLILGLIGFMGSSSVLMAGQTDPPHQTHLDHLRGPGMGGGGSPCLNCHTGSPGQDNVDLGTCNSCHSPGGAFDKDTYPDLWAVKNWENIGLTEDATESMIYDGSAMRSGKEKWCATCHDQDPTETTLQIDDFETYTDDASLQAVWVNSQDARVPLLDLSGGVDGSKCMNVRIKWTRNATYDFGQVKRTYDPYIDLTGMDYFNFYVRIDQPSRFNEIMVRLIKYPGGEVCKASFDTYELPSDQWRLASLPRSSFNDPTWGQVSTIQFRIFEYSPGSDYEEIVYIDNAYCSKVEPLPGGGGPNVVGDNQTYGYYITGHHFRNCTWCHDPTSAHIDGESLPVLEYVKNTPNPTNFRFYDDPAKQLRLPYNYDNTSVYNNQDFALCCWCHSETNLIGDVWGDGTNFKDVNSGTCGMPKNYHYVHVYMFADDQWPQSCVHCHDPHGQINPAMTRKEMGNPLVFDDNGCEIARGGDSDGDGVDDQHDPDVNKGLALQSHLLDLADGPTCNSCHYPYYVFPPNEPPCNPGDNPYSPADCLNDGSYLRTYAVLPHTGGMKIGPDCFTAGCHTVSQNHATHFVNDKGPRLPQDEIGCYYCHDDGRAQCGEDGPYFKSGTDENGDARYNLSETNVCDSCHSQGGP